MRTIEIVKWKRYPLPTVRTSAEYNRKDEIPDKYRAPCQYYNDTYGLMNRSDENTYGYNENT